MPRERKTLGGMAKEWLRAQSKELLTTDRHEREAADARGEQLEREMKDHATGEAIIHAVPGLKDFRDRMDANEAAAEAEREQRRIDELNARPLAGVGLAVSGGLDGSWAGQLPAKVELDEENGILVVDLEAKDHEVPAVAGEPLHGWRFAIPDYTGPGTYDLYEIVQRREAEGGYVEYTDWCLGLGHPDDPFYWTGEEGSASIEVGDDERSIVVRMTVTAAGAGPYDVVAQVNLPEH